MHHSSRTNGISLTAAAHKLAQGAELPPKTKNSILGLIDQFQFWREEAEKASPAELIRSVLDQTGYLSMLEAENTLKQKGGSKTYRSLQELLRNMINLEIF